jgi:K+-sensing histidine kinase KdpD
MTRDFQAGRTRTRERPRALRLPDDDGRRWLYGLAPVVATVLVRWLLEPMLEEKSPFLLFTLAVLLAAAFGGVWVGAAGAAIGGVAGLFFPADTRVRTSRASDLRVSAWDSPS